VIMPIKSLSCIITSSIFKLLFPPGCGFKRHHLTAWSYRHKVAPRPVPGWDHSLAPGTATGTPLPRGHLLMPEVDSECLRFSPLGIDFSVAIRLCSPAPPIRAAFALPMRLHTLLGVEVALA